MTTNIRSLALLLLPLLSITTLAGNPYDIWPDRPRWWESIDDQLWRNKRVSAIYISTADLHEPWGIETPPWEIAESLYHQCLYRGCNITLEYPTTLMVTDNHWPVKRTIKFRVRGYFEKEPFKGTKRHFIEVLKTFLKITYDPLTTEYLHYKEKDVENGNISHIGFRPMYIGPKLIQIRINNDNDDHLIMPFLTIQVESGHRRHLLRGMCEGFKDKKDVFMDHMKHKYGTELVLHRMGCLNAMKSEGDFMNFVPEPAPKPKETTTPTPESAPTPILTPTPLV